MPDVQFTILTNRMKPADAALPPNVAVETLHARLGPYYYGCADYLFGRAVLRIYPTTHSFWKQFDVLHLNQTMGPALLQLQKTGIPLCLLIHHPVSADLAVALEESSFFEGLRWRAKYALLLAWQKRFCRVLTNIVTVSHTAADRIAADYGCDRSKIRVVPNGVDGSVFAPGDLRSASYDVAAVGAFIHPRKGFRYLLEVYRSLIARGFRIADVGRRSDAQLQALKALPGVTVFGTVPEEELLRVMRDSAVLLSTSLYEGFGLSLIEALSCGRPAFAFDAGATKEVLSPIDAALIVPIRDADALVVRVQSFLALSAEEREKKGREYRERVLAGYSLAQAAAALHSLYEACRL